MGRVLLGDLLFKPRQFFGGLISFSVNILYEPAQKHQDKTIKTLNDMNWLDHHAAISVIVIEEAATPPILRAPPLPLKVTVPAAFPPARTRNVVALVVPAVIQCVNEIVIPPAVSLRSNAAAIALAPESWNKATARKSPAVEFDPINVTSIFSLFVEALGVIAKVMYSTPSVFCGIVSSRGISVVPVAKAPV
jgi:hypothetical protein